MPSIGNNEIAPGIFEAVSKLSPAHSLSKEGSAAASTIFLRMSNDVTAFVGKYIDALREIGGS